MAKKPVRENSKQIMRIKNTWHEDTRKMKINSKSPIPNSNAQFYISIHSHK